MVKIEKKITLDFLDEEYADSYVKILAIPVKEFDELADEIAKIQKNDDGKKSMDYIVKIIKDRFVSGSIKQGEDYVELTADSLTDMPGDFFLGVLERLSGNLPKA